nr:hypothetical protein [Streptomyces sp. S1D4-11]
MTWRSSSGCPGGVLPGVVHHVTGEPRGLAGDPDQTDVDAALAQRRDDGMAVRVVTHARREPGRRAVPGRRHRLVGALPRAVFGAAGEHGPGQAAAAYRTR